MHKRRMTLKSFLFLLVFFLTGLHVAVAGWEDAAALNKAFAHKSIHEKMNDVTRLTYPIHCKWIVMILDGGTVHVLLQGGNCKEFSVYFDHRLDKKTEGRMYMNRHPDEGDLIELHSDTEKNILNPLKEIICANINQQQINALISGGNGKKIDMLPFEDDRAALLLQEVQQYQQAFHFVP